MDTIVIADAGLPIPKETQRIDLALAQGIPGFIETLRVILEEIQIERAIVAEEMVVNNPKVYEQLEEILKGIPVDTISHEEFKGRTRAARAVVRTGEYTPYANTILVSGVVF